MTEPLRVTAHSINIVAGEKLRPGDVISARITDVLPGNKFRILWNGRTLTAESQLNLKQGQIIQAKVEKGASGTLLKLLNRGNLPQRSGSPGSLPAQTPRQMLSAAFLRASMPLPGESDIQRMSNLLGRTRGRRERMARLQADLVSRGADPSADFLEGLDELLSGSRDRGGDNPGSSRKWPEPPSPEEIREALEDDEQDPLVEMLNRVPGKSDSWTFHQISAETENSDIRFALKIRHGHRPALALTVHDGSVIREFLLDGLSPVHMVMHAGEGALPDDETWKSFRERLSLMNISVDDTISPMEASDGFSSGELE